MDDARYNTKAYLDSHLTAANLTKDDGATPAEYIVAYGWPDYPLTLVFLNTEKRIDLVFSIGTPETEALPVGVGYMENVPIEIGATNKTGVTGTKLRWKAENELRSVVEDWPTGSLRTLTRISDEEKRLGSTILYAVQYVLRYKRYA